MLRSVTQGFLLSNANGDSASNGGSSDENITQYGHGNMQKAIKYCKTLATLKTQVTAGTLVAFDKIAIGYPP